MNKNKFGKSLKGFEKGLDGFLKIIKEGQRKEEELINFIIPLLSQKTKRKIINDRKSRYLILKQPFPDDKYLLEQHLYQTIEDFDQNVNYLDKSKISEFAKILNKKPLKSFFIGDE